MEKILDDRQFHCFPTVPDFTTISGDRKTSVLADSSDIEFYLWHGGTGTKYLKDMAAGWTIVNLLDNEWSQIIAEVWDASGK